MAQFARVRTVVTVAAAVLVLAAATATAAALITGADVKNGSLTGDDIKDGSLAANEIKDATLKGVDVKDGSLGMVDMGSSVKKSIPIRVTADLPTNGFVVTAASTLVENTGDGVTFGPYENGGGEFGSLCTSVLDGLPLSDVTHLAFIARYTAEGDTGGVGVPVPPRLPRGDRSGRPHHLLPEHAATRPGYRRRSVPHLGRHGRRVEVQR